VGSEQERREKRTGNHHRLIEYLQQTIIFKVYPPAEEKAVVGGRRRERKGMAAFGTCLCGSVRFGVERSVERCLVSFNHGKAVRGGAALVKAILAPSSIVVLEDPQGKLGKFAVDSVERSFCKGCGCLVMTKNLKGSGNIELNAGLFQSSEIPKPMYHINCSDALQDVINALSDNLERFEALPTKSAQNASSPNAMSNYRQTSQPSETSQPLSSSSPQVKTLGTPQQHHIRLHSPHIINEMDPINQEHSIISVPMDSVVELVSGDLENGLGGPYADYVEVKFKGKVGKISRKVAAYVYNQDLHRTTDAPISWPASSAQNYQQPPPAIGRSFGSGDFFGAFIPSHGFSGPKPGYVFATRELGTGYYKEEGLPPAAQMPPPPVQQQYHPQQGGPPPGINKRRF